MKNNNFKKFITEHKQLFLVLLLFFISCYLFKLFTYSYAMDTEKFIVNPELMLNDWLGINRFSLVALKRIIAFIPFNILVVNWLTVFLFYISTIVTVYNLSKIKKMNKIQIGLFCAIIGSSPIFLEQFNFTLQSAEIAFFLILFQVGIYYFQKYIDTKKRRYLIPSIILTFVSFGAYQSFIVLFITEIIIMLLLRKQENQKMSWQEIRNYTIKSILVFLVSFICYLIVSKIIMNQINIQGSTYLYGQISWLNSSVIVNVTNICKTFIKFYFGWCFGKIHYTPINTIAFVFGIYFIYKYLKEKKYWEAVLILFVMCCPIILTIAKGSPEPIRAQLALPLVIGSLVSFIPWQKKSFIVSLIGLVMVQWVVCLVLQHQDYVRYQNDVAMAQDIYSLVGEYTVNRKTVFVGAKNSELDSFLIKGEAMGYSFFNSYGFGDRAGNFMKSLGYNIDEEYSFLEEAKILVQEKEAYPNKDCILITDTHVIVKLS